MNNLYQFDRVGFRYGSEGFRLGPVDLEIRSKTITAFLGPNGAGKSTLLNILAFLDLPAEGELFYQGIRVAKSRLEECKKTVGYIQQNPYLLRGNVFRNVELGLKLQHVDKVTRQKRVANVLQLMNIETLSDRSAQRLSGGEAQKVAIARALVLEPEVLILDEPFTFLDKQSIQDLEDLVHRLRDDLGKTIILTTHNQIQAQRLADTVYNVVQGKLFSSQFVNVFTGNVDDNSQQLDTGRIRIHLPEKTSGQIQIAIDPTQIVLSRHKLESSMQNNFHGVVKAMEAQNGQIKVTMDASEEFQVIVSHESIRQLGLSIGEQVWIGFKSASILLC